MWSKFCTFTLNTTFENIQPVCTLSRGRKGFFVCLFFGELLKQSKIIIT